MDLPKAVRNDSCFPRQWGYPFSTQKITPYCSQSLVRLLLRSAVPHAACVSVFPALRLCFVFCFVVFGGLQPAKTNGGGRGHPSGAEEGSSLRSGWVSEGDPFPCTTCVWERQYLLWDACQYRTVWIEHCLSVSSLL